MSLNNSDNVLIPWRDVLTRVDRRPESLFVNEDSVIVGDPALCDVIRTKSQSDEPFLLVGEKGSGTNVIAGLIHRESPRRLSRFLDANMDGSESDLDRLWFGTTSTAPVIESCNGGTIHFDILEDLVNVSEWYLQNLINLAKSRFFQCHDGSRIDLNIRVIGGTMLSLEAFERLAEKKGKLAYLYSVFQGNGTVKLSPIRTIATDSKEFTRILSENLASRVLQGTPTAVIEAIEVIPRASYEQLRRFTWPLNFRDLFDVVGSALKSGWETAVSTAPARLKSPIVPKLVRLKSYVHDLFISYTEADASSAKEIKRRASQKGIKAYLAKEELKYGRPWKDDIRKALRSSREMCVLVTKKSLGSEWVTTEWGAAWALDLPLTPILLDCTEDDLPDRLRDVQCLMFSDLDRYLDELADEEESNRGRSFRAFLTGWLI